MMENIDKYFKEQLEDFVESPSPNTWDKIANQLGHDRKRKSIVLFWRIAAGIALLVSLSILMNNSQKKSLSPLADKTVELQKSSAKSADTDKTFMQDTKNDNKYTENNEIGISGEHLPYSEATIVPEAEKNDKSIGTENTQITGITGEKSALSDNSLQQEEIGLLKSIACNKIEPGEPSIAKSIRKGTIPREPFAPSYTIDQLLAMNEEEPADKTNNNLWTVGGQFAPQYTYRNVVSDKFPDYVLTQINSKESPVITYSGGLNVTLSPNKRLSIQSGIYYSKYGQKNSEIVQLSMNNTDWDNTDIEFDPSKEYNQTPIYSNIFGSSTNQVIIYNKSQSDSYRSPASNLAYYAQPGLQESNIISTTKPLNSVNQYFEYLEIPVNLKYKVVDRKIDFSVIGGVSTNFLMTTGINLNYTDNSTKNINASAADFNAVNYAGSVGFGMECPLIKNFLLSVEPKFKYYLNSIKKESLSNIHPYTFGIYTGISYIF